MKTLILHLVEWGSVLVLYSPYYIYVKPVKLGIFYCISPRDDNGIRILPVVKT